MATSLRTLCSAAGLTMALLLGAALPRVPLAESLFAEDPAVRAEEQRQFEVYLQVTADRFEAVDELLAGRRSLAETATRFRQLNDESPVDMLPCLRTFHPDCSDDELHYRHVLKYVEAARLRGETSDHRVEAVRHELNTRQQAGDFP